MNDDSAMQWWAECGQWALEDDAIRTCFVHPPIPSRGMDWEAVRASYEPGDPIGRGPTEQAAINDLKEQEQDR